MSLRSALPVVLLVGGLPGCGASTPRTDVGGAELQARSARAEATREHARLIELEARLSELERRLARKTPACEATPESSSLDVASSGEPSRTEPLRSEGDFLTEARAVAPGARRPAAKVALGAPPQATTAPSERERLEQLLQELRAYGFDPQSGLSPERREALRVLIRRERQLDLMNPWDGH